MDRVDHDWMDHYVQDLDVDEVETTPRMSSVGPSTAVNGSDESDGHQTHSISFSSSLLPITLKYFFRFPLF